MLIDVADCQAQHGLVRRLDKQELLDPAHPLLLSAQARCAAAQHKVGDAAARPGIPHRVDGADAGQISLATQATSDRRWELCAILW